MSFDFSNALGSDMAIVEAGSRKLPAVGGHEARIRSIIGLGAVESSYMGVSKGFFPTIGVIFELLEEGDYEDDKVTPLVIDMTCPLQTAEGSKFNTLVRTFLKADGTQAKSLDELIGCAGVITIKHSDDGKYAQVVGIKQGGLTAILPKYLPAVKQLHEGTGAVGHVPFHEMTEKALLECNTYRHITDGMMTAKNYAGSKAEQVITTLRTKVGYETFGDRKKKKEGDVAPAAKRAVPNPALTEEQEY